MVTTRQAAKLAPKNAPVHPSPEGASENSRSSSSPRLPTPLVSVPRVLQKGSVRNPLVGKRRGTGALGESQTPQEMRSAHTGDTLGAIQVAPEQTTLVSHRQMETETTQEHIIPVNNASRQAGLADARMLARTEPSKQPRRMNLSVKATIERAESNSPSSTSGARPSGSAVHKCQSLLGVCEASSPAQSPRSQSPVWYPRTISRTPEQPILNHCCSSSVISSAAPSIIADLVQVAGRNMHPPTQAYRSYVAPQCEFPLRHQEPEEDRIQKMMIKREQGMFQPRHWKHPWSEEETERLVELFSKYGPSWALILQKDKETGQVFAPCRTNVDLKDCVQNIKTDMLRKQALVPQEFSDIYLGDKEIRSITRTWQRMEL